MSNHAHSDNTGENSDIAAIGDKSLRDCAYKFCTRFLHAGDIKSLDKIYSDALLWMLSITGNPDKEILHHIQLVIEGAHNRRLAAITINSR